MEVFIGNLAPNVSVTDLIGFFKGFSGKAKIRIVEKQLEDGTKCRFGIADFESDRLALKAIKKLNQKPLRGELVMVREYVHRSYYNERRAVNWRDKPWEGVERRQHERRRKETHKDQDSFDKMVEQSKKNEEAEADKVSITGYTNLARKT
jgi:RNA recognition motif-containing protein